MIPEAEGTIIGRHEPVAQVEKEAADPHLLLVDIMRLNLLQVMQ